MKEIIQIFSNKIFPFFTSSDVREFLSATFLTKSLLVCVIRFPQKPATYSLIFHTIDRENWKSKNSRNKSNSNSTNSVWTKRKKKQVKSLMWCTFHWKSSACQFVLCVCNVLQVKMRTNWTCLRFIISWGCMALLKWLESNLTWK